MCDTTLPRILLIMCLAIVSGCYDVPACVDCTDGGSDGPDGDGHTDSDGDTISDADERSGTGRDTDGDTVPDYLDTDSDGDGFSDAEEAGDDDIMTDPRDSDSDGTPDYIDTDSDANGIDDDSEGPGDMDDDTILDVADLDDDGDGCIDAREGSGGSTGPVDTDGDGAPDHRDEDADDDTISDEAEGCTDDCDGDLVPNRVDTDSDSSGVDDLEEGETHTDEASSTGPDGVPDYCDPDNDGDGIKDRDEISTYGTDPNDWDTDGDGDFDYLEIVAGTDPLESSSSLPGDLIIVGPGEAGPDFTAFARIPRVDLSILASTAGDISDELADLATDLPSALEGLGIPDMEVSIAAFEDFGSLGYGPTGAVPLDVLLHSTPDEGGIASGLADLDARGSLMAGTIDERVCGVEAVHQMISGEGLGSGLIPHATCSTSPLEPARFGLACVREDAYTILAVISDRLSWNAPGCMPGDTTCEYDEDDFPPMQAPHSYFTAGGVAYDKGVRVIGIVPDPAVSLGEDPGLWIERFASDTSTVDGAGDPVVVSIGTDASSTAEALAGAVETLVTASPFDAVTEIVDLPDSPPQHEISVHAYTLTALPVACDPPSGAWGSCSFSGNGVQGCGPSVNVTVRLSFSAPTAHRSVDILAFEVRLAVEGRMAVDTRRGYLIVPQTWSPEL